MFPSSVVIRTRSPREFNSMDASASSSRSLISREPIQLGPERGSNLHHHPPRDEPRRPSIHGCYFRTRLQILKPVPTPLKSLFNSSIRVIPFPPSRPIVRNTKRLITTWFSLQGAPQLWILLNAFVLLHMPRLKMPSILPLPSSPPTDWM